MIFFFLTDGWGRVGFQNIVACARDGQDKFIVAHRFKDGDVKVSPSATPWVSFCRLGAWTNQSVWRLT